MRCASPPDKRAALAVQREITEADVFQKAEPRADFLDDFGGDFLLELRQLERGKKIIRLFHGQPQTSMMDRPGIFNFGF
jgi:hypothetical protein